MTPKKVVRVSAWVGFGVFLIVGLAPSVLYGAYIGLAIVRKGLELADPASATGKTIVISCASVSVILTGFVFVAIARAVGRSIARRQEEQSAE